MRLNGERASAQNRPRRLLLCLDGVPYTLIEAAMQRGLFDGFHAPARLLSPFPTMTNIALSAMFGATPPHGYESLYFDKGSRQMRGGISKYLGRRTPEKMPSSYMEELDYQEPLAFEFLVYVAPDRVWRADMRRFRDRFRAAPQWRDYFAFLKGTDGLLHICGPARLAEALESLDAILSELQRFCGEETEIVLFSDHGMNLQENRRVHLKTFLENRGYKWRTRIENGSRETLAIPAFGLCGYAALYCADEDAIPLVADALAELEGVDFSVYREGEAVAARGPGGRAVVEQRKRNGGVSYRYNSLDGDPLRLGKICRLLQDKERMNAEGFASEQTWFENTAGHTYPDVLANLYKTVHANRVRHTADVLVSFRDGYYYGWSPFARMVHLAATHGNALGPSSNAFMMSTHRDLPQYVRADDAQPLLRG